MRVLAGATKEDEDALRAANRAGVPIVAVQTGGGTFDVPYVLATDVVAVPRRLGLPGRGDRAGACDPPRRRAASASPRGCPCSAEPVCDASIERFSRKNGLLGVAIFVPGADFPS